MLKLPKVFLTESFRLSRENREKFFDYLTLATQGKLVVDKNFRRDAKKMSKEILARQEENLKGCINKGFMPFSDNPLDGGVQWYLFKGDDTSVVVKEVEKALEMEDSSPPIEPDCSGKPIIGKPFIHKVGKNRILVTQTQTIDC